MPTDSGPARALRTPGVPPGTGRQPAPSPALARQGLRSAAAELTLLSALLTEGSLAPRRGLSVSKRRSAAWEPRPVPWLRSSHPSHPFPTQHHPLLGSPTAPGSHFLPGTFPSPRERWALHAPAGAALLVRPPPAPVPAELRAALRGRGGSQGGPGAGRAGCCSTRGTARTAGWERHLRRGSRGGERVESAFTQQPGPPRLCAEHPAPRWPSGTRGGAERCCALRRFPASCRGHH